ncbi:MAG: hypothetical protein L3J65_12100, partial [Robiginitomaculum sp.]|nr:hypothetical protein [Robiginitomaculum sp.]
KIVNVERFLYGRSRPDPEPEQNRAAHLKLWGVDIQDKNISRMLRSNRAIKPICFTPDELAHEAVGAMQDAEKPPAKASKKLGTTMIYPPPENGCEKAENFDDIFIREPP